MTRGTLLTTAFGRLVDLLHPHPRDIQLPDIAEHVVKPCKHTHDRKRDASMSELHRS